MRLSNSTHGLEHYWHCGKEVDIEKRDEILNADGSPPIGQVLLEGNHRISLAVITLMWPMVSDD